MYRADREPVWFCDDGECRFDPIEGGACYASTSMLGAFIEKFGRVRLISESFLEQHRIAVLYPGSDMRVLDLTNRRNLGLRGIASSAQAGLDYGRSQAVARLAIAEGLGGVKYHARHDLSSQLVSVAVLSDKSGLDDHDRLIVGDTSQIPEWLIRKAELTFAITVMPVARLVFDPEERSTEVPSWELSDAPPDE
jgi:hypothetical protein